MAHPKTLRSLERELEAIGADEGVIEGDWRESDIRVDGGLRSNTYPRDPGIVVSFTSAYGPLRIPCDYFRDWRHNLRAIALHLERLRLAKNYGVGEHGEQYRGWKMIEAPAASMTVEMAALFVAITSLPGRAASDQKHAAEHIITSVDQYRTKYRACAATLHPEKTSDGLQSEQWNTLQDAKAVLDRHHGLAKPMEARG